MNKMPFSIPTSNGLVQIEVQDRKALFILGRNGTGKSALVHYIYRHYHHSGSASIIYLPGSRPSYFDGDSLNMTANARSEFETQSPIWDSSPNTRIRPLRGTSRNERAIFDLHAAEVQYGAEAIKEIKKEGMYSPAITRLQSKASPLDRVNRLLQQANLPIQTVIDCGELRAVRDGDVYSISKMSDGERTALILIADVIAAKPKSIFLIDEPELHLHRAIVAPLLSALLVERPDCTMVISTHELALVNDHQDSPIILVRGCTWNGDFPSAWTVDVLPNSENIPDDLRVDILGSRQTILFVEGASSSRDHPLYAMLFPKVSIRHRSSCTDVRRAVVGLKQVEALHHVRAFGLVDNDGMDSGFQEKLLDEGVYALPVFAVESLYYAPEVIAKVAARQGETLNIDPNGLVVAAKEQALAKLRRQPDCIERLAARVAERQMRDNLLKAIPDRGAMVKSGDAPINISLRSPYPTALMRIQTFLSKNNLDEIVAGFPVRESGILDDIARGLRFIDHADYEKAALAAIGSDPDLASSIRAKLQELAEQLE